MAALLLVLALAAVVLYRGSGSSPSNAPAKEGRAKPAAATAHADVKALLEEGSRRLAAAERALQEGDFERAATLFGELAAFWRAQLDRLPSGDAAGPADALFATTLRNAYEHALGSRAYAELRAGDEAAARRTLELASGEPVDSLAGHDVTGRRQEFERRLREAKQDRGEAPPVRERTAPSLVAGGGARLRESEPAPEAPPQEVVEDRSLEVEGSGDPVVNGYNEITSQASQAFANGDWIYAALRYEEAAEFLVYHGAAQEDPRVLQSRFNAAMAHWNEGDLGTAQRLLEMVRGAAPDYRADVVEEKLQELEAQLNE